MGPIHQSRSKNLKPLSLLSSGPSLSLTPRDGIPCALSAGWRGSAARGPLSLSLSKLSVLAFQQITGVLAVSGRAVPVAEVWAQVGAVLPMEQPFWWCVDPVAGRAEQSSFHSCRRCRVSDFCPLYPPCFSIAPISTSASPLGHSAPSNSKWQSPVRTTV